MLEFFIALVGDSVQADKLVRFDYSAKLFPSSKSVCFSERRECPRCHHRWSDDFSDTMINLKKVDFIWINRDQVRIPSVPDLSVAWLDLNI